MTIEKLTERIQTLEDAFDASIQGGLEFKRRFERAYGLLKSIKGINDHQKWLEVQAFLGEFDTIENATYGKIVIPKVKS